MSEHEPVDIPAAPPALDAAAAMPALGAAVPNQAVEPPAPGGALDCPTCGGSLGGASPPSYVYAIGRLEARFPLLSVEKEFAQATGRAETAGLTDRQALHRVLTQREHRYLARQLCWVMTIEGLETYIVVPRDPGDIELLIESVRPAPHATDVDIVIGVKGPIAPPTLCNGLTVPIVAFDQLYSFDVATLLGAIPRPEGSRCRPVQDDSRGGVQPGHADRRQCRAHRRAPRAQLSRSALSGALCRGRGGASAKSFVKRRRGEAVGAERYAAYRRGDLFLHQSHDRRRREIFHPCRCHRAIPVPGHTAVPVFR